MAVRAQWMERMESNVDKRTVEHWPSTELVTALIKTKNVSNILRALMYQVGGVTIYSKNSQKRLSLFY